MTMHKAFHPSDDVNRLYIWRKPGGKRLTKIEENADASIQMFHKKKQRKTDYSEQKHNRQHKNQQNKNNQKTEMGRETILWAFQARNKRNLKQENLEMSKKSLKRETESLLITTQNNAIRTNHI